MFCIECGQELKGDSEFCFKCGAKAATDESGNFCIQCGKKLPEDATFCIDCGVKVLSVEDNSDEGDNFCTQCGQKLSGDSEFCFTCGAKAAVKEEPAADETPAPAPPSSNAADIYSIVDTEEIKVRQTPPRNESAETIAAPSTEQPWEPQPKSQPAPPPQVNESTDALKKQRKLVMMLFGVTIVLIIAIVGMIVFIVLNRNGGTDDDISGQQHRVPPQFTIDDFEEVGDYYVYRVAEGQIDAHPGIPIGTALDSFLTDPYWTHFSAEDIEYVSVHGYMLHEDEYVRAQFIFQFSGCGTYFHPIMLWFEGYLQDVMLMNEIFDEIAGR